ncbi:hypothetical protein AMTRI_Chr01g114740 [Amborella trichopoda]
MTGQPAMMRLSGCRHRVQATPLARPPRPLRPHLALAWRGSGKDKVVVVMGATGTGKSRLSIDLAARFPAEIINADKMQLYQGLDIVTNKVPVEERRGVPHHLLGTLDPKSHQDFDCNDFRDLASQAVLSISSRGHLPIVAGGSNSYIAALVSGPAPGQMRYECCFLWVDAALPVLHRFVSDRVEDMVEAGLVADVRALFDTSGGRVDFSRGLGKAIGVPEMDRLIKSERQASLSLHERAALIREAMEEIKANTCKLACCQLQKIQRLRSLRGWELHRLDATAVLDAADRPSADEAWERLVVQPSARVVRRFLTATAVAPMPALERAPAGRIA